TDIYVSDPRARKSVRRPAPNQCNGVSVRMPNDIDMRDGGLRIAEARRTFIALWAVVALLKLVVASQLPLFVDEAFYWQEGQHLSWAYSDLPGLTAWLIRLGVEVAGNSHLGARLPFLLMGAALPWMM